MSMDHSDHQTEHGAPMGVMDHTGSGGAHMDHSGHEQMFRRRFWRCLVLTVPVLLFSPMIQTWFGLQMPEFPASQLIGPAFAIVIFLYGGLPFLQMAVPEIRGRAPGMMTLISLAITAAF